MATEISEESWSYADWVWGKYAMQPRKPGEPPYWKVCRKRTWVHAYISQEVTTTTKNVYQCDNYGYVPIGSSCVWAEGFYGGGGGRTRHSYPAKLVPKTEHH